MPVPLSARAARVSARRPRRVISLWIAFVIAAVVAGTLIGTATLDDSEEATGESSRYEQIVAGANFDEPVVERVVVHSDVLAAGDPRFDAAVDEVASTLRRTRHVAAVGPATVSADKRTAMLELTLAGAPDDADDHVKPSLAAVSALQQKLPDVTVGQVGEASIEGAIGDIVSSDLQRAELMSLPLTFIIMLLAFGAFVAAGIPVLLGLTSVIGAIGISALVSHLVHATDSTASVIALMGMAVGVDYSLFYLKRVREEEALGASPAEALRRAAATSGQAVLVSGLTVIVACAGMLLSGSGIFVSLGVGAMIVVLIAVIGSLTVLPAALAALGPRVDRGIVGVLAAGLARVAAMLHWQPAILQRLKDRPTLIMRRREARADRGESGSRAWNALLGAVMRRPAIAATVSAAALAALAAPALSMDTGQPSVSALPDVPEVVAYERLQQAFPGTPTPAEIVVKAADVTRPDVRDALADLAARAEGSPGIGAAGEVQVNPDRTVARVEIPIAGDGADATSFAAVERLREQIVPATVGALAGVEVAVGGDAADVKDFNETMSGRLPLVLGFVLGLAFLLLLCAFRSPVIALVSVALNLLSVGAAYGVLVIVFQHGAFESVLGFESTGTVVNWIPLFLFVILFGLSMDYHVFILSRIRELVGRGVGTQEAVRVGIRDSAGTVTYAALVMVTVFSVFASLRMLEMKQMGVGLAAAVLIDATIVRAVLLPSVMALLGERNWWIPRWLRWLPRIHVEGRRIVRPEAV